MQLYHFSDEQLNNLRAILNDNKDGFTDDQWKMVNHLLSENRLNNEQFGIFVDMLDTSTQKLVLEEFTWACPNAQIRLNLTLVWIGPFRSN